jgi:REP element-mobilizing transposase RayT
MVYGYHVTFSTYGFWLPNDPRGSWSDFVGSWELFRFGPATKTAGRSSVARKPHDRQLRMATKGALKRPPVSFSGVQARAVGRGFATFVERAGLIVWACSILPEHVHMVIGRHDYNIEQVVIQLKGRATEQLIAEEIHPFQAQRINGKPPTKCWARGQWKVFLSSVEDIERSIIYVRDNPFKEGKPLQYWPFVVPFDPYDIF